MWLSPITGGSNPSSLSASSEKDFFFLPRYSSIMRFRKTWNTSALILRTSFPSAMYSHTFMNVSCVRSLARSESDTRKVQCWSTESENSSYAARNCSCDLNCFDMLLLYELRRGYGMYITPKTRGCLMVDSPRIGLGTRQCECRVIPLYYEPKWR